MAKVIAVIQYWVGNTTGLRGQVVDLYVVSKMEDLKLRTIFSTCHLKDVFYPSPRVLIIRVIKKPKQQQKSPKLKPQIGQGDLLKLCRGS